MTLPIYFHYSGADALEIRKEAETLFQTAKFNCSEAVMFALRKAFFPDIPEYIIAAVSGFPVGIGGRGCLCGAVSSAVCALGILFGREKSSELVKAAACLKLAAELHEDFTAKHKAVCCRVLTHSLEIGSAEHAKHCVNLTGDAAETAARIILREAEKAAHEEEKEPAASVLSADSKVTEILSVMPEAAAVFQGYGMTCLAHVIANDETLRVAVTHKNLPLDKICRDLGFPAP
ncbi:MAG TPA: C-GCAxxG-C-C family protein [Methanocorpusculum sp.]|nr:C-GCAxxG-C-C family protein [Methanocorpusculum sp.]